MENVTKTLKNRILLPSFSKFLSNRVNALYSWGRYMPSSRLSRILHVLISPSSQRRQFCQLVLVRNIVDDSHEIAGRDCEQCSGKYRFLG